MTLVIAVCEKTNGVRGEQQTTKFKTIFKPINLKVKQIFAQFSYK